MSTSNPYEARRSVERHDEVPAPTLDLDPTTGPETRQDLPAAPVSGEAVPDGTIKELLGWVGDDADRAKLALKKEKTLETPRRVLVAKLKKVISQ